jgi:hypothetical protein
VLYCANSTKGATFWKVLTTDLRVYIVKQWNDNTAKYVFGSAVVASDFIRSKMRILHNETDVIYTQSGAALGYI